MGKFGWRKNTVSHIRSAILRHQSPRRDMIVVLALTAMIGFVTSAALLASGFDSMWLRYLLAGMTAYAVFVALATFVVEMYKRDSAPELEELAEYIPEPSGPDVSADMGDMSFDVDLGGGDEGCAIVGILLLVAGLAVASVYFIYVAPVLFAELLLDAVIVSAAYRRMRKRAASSSFTHAYRRTRLAGILVVITITVAGAIIQWSAPAATSFGEAVDVWRAQRTVESR